MPHATRDDIELCYELEGNPDGPPLLLIAGIGMQHIDWPAHIIDALGDTHRLIRLDNRDIGLSTSLHGAPHDAGALLTGLLAGNPPEVAYTLSDMAADAVAVLDAVGVDAAHVLGISMGGMIAQTVAIEHPARVRSLISIMSTTGAADVGQPSAEALGALLSAPPADTREATIAHAVDNIRVWASPGHYDADEMAATIGRGWDRVGGRQAEGTARQFCAIIASPARDEALRTLDIATLVVHGTADTLIDVSGGHRTADCVPGAELLIIDGMGHDLAPAFAPRIVDAIRQLTEAH